MKKYITGIVLIIISFMIFGCAPEKTDKSTHDINELVNYTIKLKNVSDEEIDPRYIPVDFVIPDNSNYALETAGEPNVIDMTNYVPEPVSLDEVCSSPQPPYTLFYFVDKTGNIQLRAYGEVYQYKYLEDDNGNFIMDIDDNAEEFGKGMYAITPIKTTYDGNTVIDFSFYYEGPIEDNKPINIEDEPF